MSVDRDTLARVHRIPADQVKCANCAWHSEFLNYMLWCVAWDAHTQADWVCSFYKRESEGKDDK